MTPDRTAVMTRKEVCNYLRISDSTLDRLLKRKKMKGFRILGNGNWRFFRAEIDKAFEEAKCTKP